MSKVPRPAHHLQLTLLPRPEAVETITTYYLVRHDLSVCVKSFTTKQAGAENGAAGTHIEVGDNAPRGFPAMRACIRRSEIHISSW